MLATKKRGLKLRIKILMIPVALFVSKSLEIRSQLILRVVTISFVIIVSITGPPIIRIYVQCAKRNLTRS